MINFYKEIWKNLAHVMRPLTEKTGKVKKFEWTNEMDKSFRKIKNIISENVLLYYPKYGTKFIVHTDASNY